MNLREIEDIATEIMLFFETGEGELEEEELSTKESVLKTLKQRHSLKETHLKKASYHCSVLPSLPMITTKEMTGGKITIPIPGHPNDKNGAVGIFTTQLSTPTEYLCELFFKGIKIPEYFQEKLGLRIQYPKFSLWNKRRVAWQITAQILALEHGQFNVTHIKNAILNDEELCDLIDVSCLMSIHNQDTRGRGLEDVIRLVNPNPENERKGRAPKQVKRQNYLSTVPVPSLKSATDGIDAQILWFIFYVITKVLQLHGNSNSIELIRNHTLIQEYKKITPTNLLPLVNIWITICAKKNGSLFET
jgi:hypothetical protein